jgi:NADH-quinone oxidoreductase subunit E
VLRCKKKKEKIMSTQTLSKDDFAKVEEIIKSFDYKKSNLIAILQQVQETFRYLPEDVMTYIGTKIEDLSPATVYGVATFYSQFSLDPKGKYEIRVCDGTACHVRGSMPVLNAVRAKLNLKDGQLTTSDGLFSLETVSCLGACGLAPVMVVNGKVYPQMTSDAVKVIIDTIIQEESK